MDYILKRRGVKKANQWSLAAKGPPSLLGAVWKGMGPSGYHKPPRVVAGYFGFIFLVAVLLMSAEGLVHQQAACELDRCSDKYMAVQDDNNTCAVLRTYYQCIIRAKSCNPDPITFHALRQIVGKKLKKHNCTTTGHTIEVEVPAKGTRHPEVPAVCTFKGKPVYRYCALFGDPHLRTFGDQVQTCKVRGARPLVSNDYLTVQVTNDLVLGSVDATAISKLTVIVKGHPDCTSRDYQTYQAQSEDGLPATFDDGRTTVGPYRSLEVEEIEPGAHVRLHLRYIHTEMDIHQVGGYFTFAIKMPEELINRTASSSNSRTSARHAMNADQDSRGSGVHGGDLDLCVRGCPTSEQIDYGAYLARYKTGRGAQSDQGDVGDEEPVMSRDYAESMCREAELVDFYFDSCVFDLMTTGDENFTVSAKKALQDMVRLNPSVVRTMVNRTTLSVYDQQYNHQHSGGAGGPSNAGGAASVGGFSSQSLWLWSSRTPAAERHALCVLLACLTVLVSLCKWAVR